MKKSLSAKKKTDNLVGILFAFPWLIGFVIFSAYPILASLFFSFTEYHITLPPKWIGTGNYTRLFEDSLFIKAFYNTLAYVAGLVPIGLIVGLIIALLLVKPFKGRNFYRGTIYIPSLVPLYAFATISLWFFSPYFGIVNGLLSYLGINGPLWLSDEKWVKFTIVLIAQWGAGTTALIYMAAINDIPKELYEAAMLDGANKWQMFWKITLPIISPATLYYLIIATIGAFQIFDLPQIMTGGAPNNASLSYVMYLYRHAFRYMNMGLASAMAWFLFLISLILVMLIFTTSARWVFYGTKQ
jgi:multiple sugar transport system permease protein